MDEEDGFRRAPKPQEHILLSLVRNNLGLLVPIAAATIFAFRCTVVSDGNFYTTSLLIMQTSIGDAIRALIYPVAPTLLLVISIAAGIAAANRGKLRDRVTLGLVALSVLAFLPGGYLTGVDLLFRGPKIFFLGLVFFAIGPAAIAFMFRYILKVNKPVPGNTSVRARIRYGLALLLVAFVIVRGFGPVAMAAVGETFGTKEFWLPRERLAFQGEAAFTGYVIKSSDDYLTILNDTPRIIIEKPKSTLTYREVCYPLDYVREFTKAGRLIPICP